MAGKTFRGVGQNDDDDDRPRLIDEDDSRGLHSGPTVVDDQKVAEVLKKLRSLDKPPGPLTGVTEVVIDANSSEPTRLDSGSIPIDADTGPAIQLGYPPATAGDSGPASLQDIMYPLQRATSIGRSPSTPAVGQPVTVPADAARGTMFGHSIHLPDVNAPDAVDAELSSGGIHFLDGAPSSSQPFPLADRPAVVLPPPTSAPIARFHAPFEPDLHTQLLDPPRPKSKRMLAFVGGLSIAALAVYGWSKYGGSHSPLPEAPAPATGPAVVPLPAAPTPTPAAPAAAAPAAPTAPEPTPTAPAPAPAAAAPAAAAPTAAAREPAAATPSEDPTPRAPTASSRSRSRRSSERRSSAKTRPSAEEHKRPAAAPDDPDATMAPTD